MSASTELASRVSHMKASGYGPTKIIIAPEEWERISAEVDAEPYSTKFVRAEQRQFMNIPVELAQDSLAVRFQIRHRL
ncbi:MAG: hypothetical protein EOO81_05475 [Oxalobacteraceae bacterium]|nr:MAG: hypothetical protein EOO81_05475 [Oxalobacteraceae bacterium]